MWPKAMCTRGDVCSRLLQPLEPPLDFPLPHLVPHSRRPGLLLGLPVYRLWGERGGERTGWAERTVLHKRFRSPLGPVGSETPAWRRSRPDPSPFPASSSYSTRPRPSPCSTHHHGPAPWSADRPPAETGNFFLTLRGVLSRYTKSQNRPTRKCSF